LVSVVAELRPAPSRTIQENAMQWPEVTDAELNALVDLELGADELAPMMLHLFAEPEAIERVAAYSRQRSLLGELRREMDLRPAGLQLSRLIDELCRVVSRRQDRRRYRHRAGDHRRRTKPTVTWYPTREQVRIATPSGCRRGTVKG
jgi:anti-sigma factor RsiW